MPLASGPSQVASRQSVGAVSVHALPGVSKQLSASSLHGIDRMPSWNHAASVLPSGRPATARRAGAAFTKANIIPGRNLERSPSAPEGIT